MHGSNHANVQVQEQGLNPCGVDNVLVLQDLTQGHGYLMSLLNCFTVFDDGRAPVTSLPSTFYFQLPSSPSIKDSGGVMVNTKTSSTELDVIFDMNAVLEHLVVVLDQEEEEGKQPEQDPPASSSGEEKMTSCQASVVNHADVLRVLETLAEREKRDVDFMVAALGLVFIILVGAYGWTVYFILTKKKAATKPATKRKKSTRNALLSPARSMATFAASVDFSSRRSKTDEPPVDAVTIDRSRDAPSLVEESSSGAAKKLAFFRSKTPAPKRAIVTPPAASATRCVPAVSPCLQPEKDWEQKKVARRTRRRNRQTVLVSPIVAVPENGSMSDMSQPQESRKRIVPEVSKEEMSDAADAPLCPTSISDESAFLSDYW